MCYIYIFGHTSNFHEMNLNDSNGVFNHGKLRLNRRNSLSLKQHRFLNAPVHDFFNAFPCKADTLRLIINT